MQREQDHSGSLGWQILPQTTATTGANYFIAVGAAVVWMQACEQMLVLCQAPASHSNRSHNSAPPTRGFIPGIVSSSYKITIAEVYSYCQETLFSAVC